MIKLKNILNIVEVGLILFAIYGIGTEYSGKFSSYRGDWKILNYANTRIIIDLLVIGIFALRIFQIGRTIIVAHATISRKKILLMTVIYILLMVQDLYGYFYWYYYTHLTAAGLRLLIYTLPIIIWTYRMTRKQLITPHKKFLNTEIH